MSQYEIIREALANFLMHSDQFNTVRSCIHVFLNRIEFINGGSMPVKVNEINGQCYTNPRNPSVARLFRLADVAENVGFGLHKLLSWKSLTGNDVSIESGIDRTSVVFWTKKIENGKSSVESSVESSVKTSDRIKQVMSENPGVTLAQIAESLQVSQRSIEKAVHKLVSLGEIVRVGSKKSGTWKVLEK